MAGFSIHRISTVAATLLVILSGMSVRSLAQEKSTPPPTRMNVPADTMRITPAKPQQRDSAEINLPEVLILGKDRAVRSEGAKERITPESPALQPQEWSETPVQTEKNLQGTKMAPNLRGQQHPWKTLVRFEGGSYTTINGEASLRNEPTWGGYYLQAWLNRSNGQYENSQYGRMGLNGNLRFDLTETATGKGHGALTFYDYGLHGAQYPEFTRHGNMINAGGQFLFDISKKSTFNFSLDLNNLAMKNDTGSTEMGTLQDFWYRLGGDLETVLGGIHLNAVGTYLGETRDWSNPPIKQRQNDYAQLALRGSYPWGSTVSTEIGVSYQTSGKDTTSRLNRLSPEARLTLIITPKLGLTARAFTGFEYHAYSDRWQENPYLGNRIPLTPDDTKLGLSLRADYRIVSGVIFTGSVQRKGMNRLFYWQRDSLGVFDLHSVSGPLLWEYQAGVNAQIGSRVTADLRFIGNVNEVQLNGTNQINQIPYQPEYRIPLRVQVSLPWQVNFEASTEFVGSRPARLNADSTLSSYNYTEATVSKLFLRHYTIFFTARNILDSEYMHWEQYPETGLQLLLGLRARF